MGGDSVSATGRAPDQAPGTGAPWSAWRAWHRLIHTPVSGASLAAFRIAFGVIMLLEAVSLCRPAPSANGAVPLSLYYTGPETAFMLPYVGFEWLPVLSPGGMRAVVGLLGTASVALAVGWLPRLAAAGVFASWGYFYAIESTRTYWMSYYYLELLVAFLLVWMPTGRVWSLSRWLARRRSPAAEASGRIPFWPLLVLRGQLTITYFYAGFAKLTPDWLIDAQPVRWFLSKPHVQARLEMVLAPETARAILQSDALAYFLAWGGTLFDLVIGGLLVWRRTRCFGMLCLLFFHTTNHTLLFVDIGWFPFLGIVSATIFFEPDWPKRAVDALRAMIPRAAPHPHRPLAT